MVLVNAQLDKHKLFFEIPMLAAGILFNSSYFKLYPHSVYLATILTRGSLFEDCSWIL